uniref:CF1 epsilon subunit of ATP synthase n=1 Tax=Klebsormidium dissectum TaxID=329816 RepID=UPI00286BFABC|nr:CF1 epsilon subunit of ATP synthase [Klebsormidium dissectum]WKT06518.1 CF1 epsilon subunit of ATP synthase [Klebsormidium dissectum]
MSLNLRVMTPIRTVWDGQVQEVILPTNSGQVGILPKHASLLTALDIGVLRVRTDTQWARLALMGGFAKIEKDRVTILVNEGERASEIDPQEAQRTLELAQINLNKAEGSRQKIEAKLAFRRAKARLEATSLNNR